MSRREKRTAASPDPRANSAARIRAREAVRVNWGWVGVGGRIQDQAKTELRRTVVTVDKLCDSYIIPFVIDTYFL